MVSIDARNIYFGQCNWCVFVGCLSWVIWFFLRFLINCSVLCRWKKHSGSASCPAGYLLWHKNFIMVFDKRNMDFEIAWRLSIICSKAIWLSLIFLETIFYASYLNTYFARQSTELCLGEVQIKHLNFCFRNHLYLSPRGHQVKGWINYQVALIWSYVTGKRIIVAATPRVKVCSTFL